MKQITIPMTAGQGAKLESYGKNTTIRVSVIKVDGAKAEVRFDLGGHVNIHTTAMMGQEPKVMPQGPHEPR